MRQMRLVGTPATERLKAWQKAYMEEMGETPGAERGEDGKITGRYLETRRQRVARRYGRAGTIARKNLARTTTICFLRTTTTTRSRGERVD